MRNYPITNTERPYIIRQVADWKTWEGIRYGFRVVLRRLPRREHEIEWAVHREGHTAAGPADTISAAIDQVNDIIAAGRRAFLTAENRRHPEQITQLDLFSVGAAIAARPRSRKTAA